MDPFARAFFEDKAGAKNRTCNAAERQYLTIVPIYVAAENEDADGRNA